MARLPQFFIDLANEARNMAIVARSRETAREANSFLKRTVLPDTFLGRKTQDPFPPEQDKTD
jgi:hypothetical protein